MNGRLLSIAFSLSMCSAALLLAGCGGGGGGVSPSQIAAGTGAAAAATPTAQPAAGSGTLSISIVVPPAAGTSSTARTPKYISPGTQSIAIALKGATAPLAVANVAPTAPGCTTGSAGTTCTVTATAPAGADTFIITAYSGTNGTGSALSTETVPSTVTASSTTRLPLTLNPVPATVSVTLGAATAPAGTATSVSVTLVAYDATGAAIVGPGTFTTPVTLADSDTTGVTSLSATTVAAPGTSVTLTYNGNSLAGATITPSLGTVTGTAATFTATGDSVALYPVGLPNFEGDPFYGTTAGPSNTTWMLGSYTYANIVLGGSMIGGVLEGYQFNALGGPVNSVYYAESQVCGDDTDILGTITSSDGSVSMTNLASYTNDCDADGTTCGEVDGIAAAGNSYTWFVDADNEIGRIDQSSNVQEWSLSSIPGFTGSAQDPYAIAVTSDGTLAYIADNSSNGNIDQVTLSGGVPTSIAVISTNSSSIPLYTVAIGPDGNPWFTDGGDNIGMVPRGNFTAGALLEWSMASVAPLAPFEMVSTPVGLWFITANSNGDNNVYAVSGLTGVTSSQGPAVKPLAVFSNPAVTLTTIGVGGDNNLWVGGIQSYSYPVVAKVIYGASGTGVQSGTRLHTGASRTVLRPMSRGLHRSKTARLKAIAR